jgi:PAS domain S-box-containing protein
MLAVRLEERKQAEQALRASEAKFRGIFEHVLEGIVRTSLDGRVLNANPTLARIFGYTSPDEMIAHGISLQRQSYVRPQEHDTLVSTLSGQSAVIGYEAELYRKNGQRIWVSFSVRVVGDGSGEPVFVEGFVTDITQRKHAGDALGEGERQLRALFDKAAIGMVEDITARKRAEEALHKAQAELAHLARRMTMGELATSIAHEVNQPLAAVVTNGNACLCWLTREPPNLEQVRESVRRTIRDGNRANQAIARIRALVRKPSRRKRDSRLTTSSARSSLWPPASCASTECPCTPT